MTDQEKRIKLAEVMGWTREENPLPLSFREPAYYWKSPEGITHVLPPNPYTDANADVAILNFYGDAEDSPERERFLEILYGEQVLDYKIGDYARAALKVIE